MVVTLLFLLGEEAFTPRVQLGEAVGLLPPGLLVLKQLLCSCHAAWRSPVVPLPWDQLQATDLVALGLCQRDPGSLLDFAVVPANLATGFWEPAGRVPGSTL